MSIHSENLYQNEWIKINKNECIYKYIRKSTYVCKQVCTFTYVTLFCKSYLTMHLLELNHNKSPCIPSVNGIKYIFWGFKSRYDKNKTNINRMKMPGIFVCNIHIEWLKAPREKCKFSVIQAGASGPIGVWIWIWKGDRGWLFAPGSLVCS